MEKTHRQRLIEEGLYTPLTPHDIAERNGILLRWKGGEKIQDVPNNCVYRADSPWSNIQRPDEKQCKEAELIADRLYSWEAWRLCNSLNYHDKQQPPRPNPHHPPLEMYRIASMDDWKEWEDRHAQIEMEL